MELRRLGSTGMQVSVLGLGTVKFGRNQGVKYPHAFALPSDQEIISLLSLAKDLGINLLDTAPAYGTSEERLGKLLKQREQWIIVSKAGEEFSNGESYFDFSEAAITASVQRSLKRLRTDYLDVVLLHSNGDDEAIIQQGGLATLANLKHKGWIRAIGMSTKTVAGGLQTLQQADLAMVAYNPDYTDEKAVLDYAEQHQKGILVKKGLLSGHTKQPEQAIQFILKQPSVSSLIVGTLNPQHLRDNAQHCLA